MEHAVAALPRILSHQRQFRFKALTLSDPQCALHSAQTSYCPSRPGGTLRQTVQSWKGRTRAEEECSSLLRAAGARPMRRCAVPAPRPGEDRDRTPGYVAGMHVSVLGGHFKCHGRRTSWIHLCNTATTLLGSGPAACGGAPYACCCWPPLKYWLAAYPPAAPTTPAMAAVP